MDSNNMQNKPVRPNVQQGQRPVRPNTQNGQRPVRPNIQNGQRPVRPNSQSTQKPVQPTNHNMVNQQISNQSVLNKEIEGEFGEETFSHDNMQMHHIPKDGQMPMQINQSDNIKNEKKPKVKKEKAPKKVKEPKQPKAPKAPKAPKQPKLDSEGNPIPESKLKKFGIPAACVVGGLIVLLIVVKILKTGSDQHITLADKEPEGNTAIASTGFVAETDEDTGLNESMSDIKEEIAKEESENGYNTTSPVIGTSTDVKIAVGSVITIPVTVNTQLPGDKEYQDYYSYITVKYDGMTFGYDEVKSAIDEHNTNTKHVINIEDKDSFFKNNAGCDLVMYKFTFDIPSNFPTQDTTKHKVYISPSFGMTLEGSEESDKLITDKYTFSVPNISPMADDISLLHAGDSFSLNWIAVMPTGLDKSAYTLAFKYKISEDTGIYRVESVTIPDNGRTDEVVETQSDDKNDSEVEQEEESTTTDDDTKETEEKVDKDKPSDSGVLE